MTIRKRRQPMLSRSLTLAALGTVTLGLAIVCAPATASAKKTVLYPGDSIQAAVDAASPGDTIILMPGEYFGPDGARRAVRIKKDGIRLIGKPDGDDKVILRPGLDNEDGILVEPEGGSSCDCVIEGSVIKGITVEGFPGNGIKVEFVNNFQILNNESINNLENGIQPELSANGLVKNNLSYGSLDSAMWLEGVTNVRAIGNVLHSSVTGLEVTISKDLVIVDNEMYNNTVGMGLYHPSAASEPALPVMEDWKVMNNYIHDNNLPNGAPGGLPALLPPGGGVLLMGVSDNKLAGNLIENNDFFGLAVIDFCFALTGSPGPCGIRTTPPGPNWSGADPVPRNNRIAGKYIRQQRHRHPPDASAGPISPRTSSRPFSIPPQAIVSTGTAARPTPSIPGGGWSRCRRRVPEKRSGLIISSSPTREPSRSGGGLKRTRGSLFDSIPLAPGGRLAMPLTETNNRVHRLSRPDDQTDPGDCSTLLRRVSGPVADELYFLCRPECGTTDVAAQAEAVYRAMLELLASEGASVATVASETLFVSDNRRDLEVILDTRRQVLEEAEPGRAAR